MKNSQISPEELSEFRDCFSHFDKDKSGFLSRLELGACLKSLGENLSEDQLSAVLQEAGGEDGKVSFDEFVKYMVKSRKGSDSSDNIKSSFRIMADDKPYITEAQLRAVLPANRVEYLLEHMPRHAEAADAYDYEKFTDDVYAQ